MARRGKSETLGSLIPSVLDDLGLDRSSSALRLIRVWDEALGPRLAAHCRPDGVRGDVLYARVPDSAWMQRIQLEKLTILERLEAALGEPAARDLRLRIGALDL
jgi:predicted nucleic acid-binding Zn ribbon protein